MLDHLINAIKASIKHSPFTHAKPWPALDPDLFQELSDAFPDPKFVINGRKVQQNTLYQRHAHEVLKHKDTPAIWRELFAEATSPEFWHKIAELTGAEEKGKVGLRFAERCDIEMDCLFAVNTPVETVSSVKGPHLDNPREIYACLIYMPEEGDMAQGHLMIYRATKDRPRFFGKQMTTDVEIIDSVLYEPNNAIFFHNGPRALHGVSDRLPTKHYRRYLNIEAEFKSPRFEVR